MKILRETTHDVAVIKPSGTACEMRADVQRESLLSKLQAGYPDRTVKLPHRIDRIARGIVLAALSDEAVRYYNEQIQHGLWDKYYLCRAHAPRGFKAAALLGRHKAFLKKHKGRSEIVRSGGAPSFLEILAIEEAPERLRETHVLIRLLTGRYHQIRAMLENLDIPLVGDPLYGGKYGKNMSCPEGQCTEGYCPKGYCPKGSFYLEHIILRYRDFSLGQLITLHLSDDPDRERISNAAAAHIRGILNEETDE